MRHTVSFGIIGFDTDSMSLLNVRNMHSELFHFMCTSFPILPVFHFSQYCPIVVLHGGLEARNCLANHLSIMHCRSLSWMLFFIIMAIHSELQPPDCACLLYSHTDPELVTHTPWPCSCLCV